MLANNLNKIASNFSGTPQEFIGPSASFVCFIRERSTEMAINGHKGMAFSMNDSQWSLDQVKSSLNLLRADGFDTKIISKIHKLDGGEEGIEFIVNVEWK
jgi:hypothetical protein